MHFFDGYVDAGLLKNKCQLSLTPFLEYSSKDKQLLFWWLSRNVESLDNTKQDWVPGGWLGGFGLNIGY